jgi:hypothetical protein
MGLKPGSIIELVLLITETNRNEFEEAAIMLICSDKKILTDRIQSILEESS